MWGPTWRWNRPRVLRLITRHRSLRPMDWRVDFEPARGSGAFKRFPSGRPLPVPVFVKSSHLRSLRLSRAPDGSASPPRSSPSGAVMHAQRFDDDHASGRVGVVSGAGCSPRGKAISQMSSSSPIESGSARYTSRHDSLVPGRATASCEQATAS